MSPTPSDFIKLKILAENFEIEEIKHMHQDNQKKEFIALKIRHFGGAGDNQKSTSKSGIVSNQLNSQASTQSKVPSQPEKTTNKS